jgi:hypothetical protein
MMNIFLVTRGRGFWIVAFWWMTVLTSFGQTSAYVNHTEVGPLIGKVSEDGKRLNFSFQTFNGIQLNRYHELGFLIGLDSYPGFKLMPLAIGWRGILDKDKKISPYASMDFGYGSAWLEKRMIENQMESWYQGGTYISPAIGLRKKSKKGDMAFTWSAGFKRQNAFFYEGFRMQGFISGDEENNLPPGFSSIREESYIFNSLYLKIGIVF